MPTYQLLTDRTLAHSSAITPTTLIHIVYTGDPSQNLAGSSYKAELQQLSSIFSGGTDTLVTGGTYSAGTIIFTNSSGGTFPVTGLTEGSYYLPLSGGTVTGNTIFNQGLTANTMSASTIFVNGVQITSNNNLLSANNILRFEDTDTLATSNQMSGKIEFFTSDTTGSGVRSYIAGVVDTSANGNLIFATAFGSGTTLTGGTTTGEKMRIDENGYVGIGTSNPLSALHVNSGDFVIDQIALRSVNNETTPKGVFIIPVAGDESYNFNTISGDTVITSTGGRSLIVGAGGTGSGFRFSGTSTPTPFSAIITTGAKIGVGPTFYSATSEPSQFLDVDGNARFRTVGAGAFSANLNITADGTLTTQTSDVRLKENIEPLSNSLEKLLQLTGVTYSWIGQEGKRIGFIAQEVEKVIPELVFINENTEDKIKGIHLDNITAVLVESIKEQQKIIEELKTEINNLKIRLDNL